MKKTIVQLGFGFLCVIASGCLGGYLGLRHGVTQGAELTYPYHARWVLLSGIKNIEIYESLEAGEMKKAKTQLLEKIENEYLRVHNVVGVEIIKENETFTGWRGQIEDFIRKYEDPELADRMIPDR